MRANYIPMGISAALLFGYAIANGQAAQHAQQAPMAPGVTSHIEDPTATDPNQAPKTVDPEQPTAGHDDVSGQDQIAADGTQAEKANVKHPDFASLDPNNHGYLTTDDVKYNKWLSANFSRCDTNHDGHLTQQEYANCK